MVSARWAIGLLTEGRRTAGKATSRRRPGRTPGRGRPVTTLSAFDVRRSSSGAESLVKQRTGDVAVPAWGGPRLSAPVTQPLEHTPGLDGVRAVAVFTVVGLHLGIYRPFERNALPGGHLGVDLFFVLSGFLITSLLLKEHSQTGRIRLLAFYGRRALRLFPAPARSSCSAMLVYAGIEGVESEVQRNTVFAAVAYLVELDPDVGMALRRPPRPPLVAVDRGAVLPASGR